ncbi:hypothetical protein BD770DRAFT_444856 [Pilaira anomala]|nr:hypothetical protein BD770DRAFT_444856 [Pilaira anomala]
MTESVKSNDKKKINKDVEEALKILEEEKNKRIEDIRQRTAFMCASLRAHGKTQLSKLLKSVKELTVQEFCETYGANTEYFVQESRKRLASQPINTAPKRHKTNEKVVLELDLDSTVGKFKFNLPAGSAGSTRQSKEILVTH